MYRALMNLSRAVWALAGVVLVSGCGKSDSEKQAEAAASAAVAQAAAACADGKKALAEGWGKYGKTLEILMRASIETRATDVAAEQATAELARLKKGDKSALSDGDKAMLETTAAEFAAAKATLDAVKAAEKAAPGPTRAAREASKTALEKATALRDLAPKVFDAMNAARVARVKQIRYHLDKAKEFGGKGPEIEEMTRKQEATEGEIAKDRSREVHNADTLLAQATAADKQTEVGAACKDEPK